MAAKEYKVNTVAGVFITMANSAEQAARRAERWSRDFSAATRTGLLVDQKRHVSNVTRKQAV